MTQWLKATQTVNCQTDRTDKTDRTAPGGGLKAQVARQKPDLSVLSDRRGGGQPSVGPERSDTLALHALLRERGPMTYGMATSALGWGATRAWQAEAALRASGHLIFDRQGRAALEARADE